MTSLDDQVLLGPPGLLDDVRTALYREGICLILDVEYFSDYRDPAVAEARKIGRRAGRELGFKVRTYVIDIDHRTEVFVLIKESNPIHQELMRIRGHLDKVRDMKRSLESYYSLSPAAREEVLHSGVGDEGIGRW